MAAENQREDGAVGKSSRSRYQRYREQVEARRLEKAAKGKLRKSKTSSAKAADEATDNFASLIVAAPDRAGSRKRGDVILGKEKSRSRTRSFGTLFHQFWALLRGHEATVIASLATLSVSTLFGLLPLYGTKLVFDNVLIGKPLSARAARWLPGDPRPLLMFVAIGMVTLAGVSTLIGTWSRWQATRVSKRIVVAARRKVFEHTVRLPLHRVYELKSGGVASLLREDAGGVGELLFSMIYNPWRAIVQLVGCLCVLAWVDWRMLLGSLLLLPVVWMTHRTWIGRIRPLFRDIGATRQGVDAHAAESFGGMRVVRSFGRQRHETALFTGGNHLMARQEILSWWWSRGIDIAWGIIIPVASAILLWYGGGRVLHDSQLVKQGLLDPKKAMTPGDLVMFLGYLAQLLGPIAALAQSATGLQTNLAGLDRTLDVLEEPGEMPNKPNARPVIASRTAGRITFRDVGFNYAGSEKTILHHVDLDVLPGQTLALVGPSGAGKTTLCNLVARFYDPTRGSVRLDGIDLRDLDVDGYRRLLGIVEQDTFLFDGTIADNIAYGRRNASMPQIIAAAEKANAHTFITGLEYGYDTLIGERGVKLSGGQRQRLTIARAILADPKILILDEATSNLDTESERLIQGSLATLMRDRTCFVIAHRLSTIAHADKIVVIENGVIAEQGTHAELMASSGRYRQMVDLQTRPPDPPKDIPPQRRPEAPVYA